jgi:hypothetical protein
VSARKTRLRSLLVSQNSLFMREIEHGERCERSERYFFSFVGEILKQALTPLTALTGDF